MVERSMINRYLPKTLQECSDSAKVNLGQDTWETTLSFHSVRELRGNTIPPKSAGLGEQPEFHLRSRTVVPGDDRFTNGTFVNCLPCNACLKCSAQMN